MTTGPGRGVEKPGAHARSVAELSAERPGLPALLREMGIPVEGHEDASFAWICEEAGVDPGAVLAALDDVAPSAGSALRVTRLDILGGRDKGGVEEPVRRLTLRVGQAVALVGATGSGKSQVLADVESLAGGDSPSGRVILIDGAPPADELRWSPSFRPVAQVSQGMRYLLDMQVGPFLAMHAEIRGIGDTARCVAEVIEAACGLCGEPFGAKTQLAALSGGQSRALMIADAGLLSRSPIILVDEIENAGIDREQAIDFLVDAGKIALIATHDPLIALRADQRVIMRNGAMQQVLERSSSERAALRWLEAQEGAITALRASLRAGGRLAPPGRDGAGHPGLMTAARGHAARLASRAARLRDLLPRR